MWGASAEGAPQADLPRPLHHDVPAESRPMAESSMAIEAGIETPRARERVLHFAIIGIQDYRHLRPKPPDEIVRMPEPRSSKTELSASPPDYAS